jgi:predicted metal-dependent phosphoesterase TrpH
MKAHLPSLERVDLHCHSFYSDGDCSPQEILSMAENHKLNLLALTDHDTIQGYFELKELAAASPISIVPGLECSVTWQGMELHVLGLGVDPSSHALQDYIVQQGQKRFARAIQIAELLSKQGVSHALSGVLAIAGHYGISRTHFAKYLVQAQKVTNTQMAFKKYLGARAPAYVASNWYSLENTIELIQAAGGVAVLAHPLHYSLSTAQLKGLVKQFKHLGGRAIEVVSGPMKSKDIQRLMSLALNFNLGFSSGSDFHRKQAFRPAVGAQLQLQSFAATEWMQELIIV